MEQQNITTPSSEQILRELAAIGFARATDYLSVDGETLVIRSTSELSREKAAAIAAIERTSSGIKVKFYDKLKALELLGKQMGLFDGKGQQEKPRNNLLEAILAATGEVITTHDLPELQQAAAAGYDLVEQTGPEGP